MRSAPYAHPAATALVPTTTAAVAPLGERERARRAASATTSASARPAATRLPATRAPTGPLAGPLAGPLEPRRGAAYPSLPRIPVAMSRTIDALLPLSLLEGVRAVDRPVVDPETEFVDELRN